MLDLNTEKSIVIDNVYCKYFIKDKSIPLVITFGNAGADSIIKKETLNKQPNISPWGYDFIKKKNLNVISFASIDSPNWYRSEIFHNWLQTNSDYFKSFISRLGYGGSMGGFAVGCFQEIFDYNSVLLINPISTLSEEIVPWETRFSKYKEQYNFSINYNDKSTNLKKGYIIYDPIFNLDKKHAKRYTKLTHITLPGVGHQVPVHLKNLNLLTTTLEEFLFKEINTYKFYRKSRARRYYHRYYTWLLSEENTHLTKKRREIIIKHKKILEKLGGSNNSLNNSEINQIRDYAIEFEKQKNIESALQLMKIAQKLRPQGPTIRKKLLKYRQLLKK
jgi:hypothetical protein